MRIIVAPSEGKQHGGDGAPLDLDQLSSPQLRDARSRIIAALVKLADEPLRMLDVLGLGEAQVPLVAANAQLRNSPTSPAYQRYNGVLHQALDLARLNPPIRERALDRIFIASAVFGLVSARDAIPEYRCSATTKLPGIGALRTIWRDPLEQVFHTWVAGGEYIVDLRSGAYETLAPTPPEGSCVVRVLSERADGTRFVVSHASKHTKGLIARALARSRARCESQRDVVSILRRAGFRVERADRSLDVIL